jgi:hypothetical protein
MDNIKEFLNDILMSDGYDDKTKIEKAKEYIGPELASLLFMEITDEEKKEAEKQEELSYMITLGEQPGKEYFEALKEIRSKPISLKEKMLAHEKLKQKLMIDEEIFCRNLKMNILSQFKNDI